MRRLRWAIFALAMLVLAVGLIAPSLKANRFRPKIKAALEAALNRPVAIGEVRLNLFRGPGFEVKDVLIADDPRAGIEPFAHVKSLQARLKLTSLFSGKLAFSHLRLEEPSVNLVRTAAGPWNIAPLLNKNPDAAPGGHKHSVPDIEISDARLDIKFGDTKSVFYITNADLEIYPNGNGDVVIRFSGEPARTDRGAQGFGRFTARGMLQAAASGEDRLNLGLHLERTSISDLMTLFFGRDIGVHGFAIANARLAGPLSKLDITGDLTMDDVHRWDLMPAKSEAWNLNLRGAWNLRSQQLELETIAPARQLLPVSLKLRAADYLSAPKWAAFVTLQHLSAAAFVEAARHMGAPLPGGLQVDGMVEGVIGYSREGGMQGTLSIEHAAVSQAENKQAENNIAEFDSLPLLISGNQLTFGPADVRLKNDQVAGIEGHYALDGRSLDLKIGSKQLTIAQIESGATGVLDASPIPVLERLRQGTFKGWVAFEKKEDRSGIWTGEYEVQNALLDVPGVAAPLRLASANVNMQGGLVQITRIRGRVGKVSLEGDYRFDLAGLRPHLMHLTIPELQVAELEQLMLPALRRQQSFLLRAFGPRQPAAPAWLKGREVEGAVQVTSLLLDDATLCGFRARLTWNGPQVRLSKIECRREDMRVNGSIAINLAGALPLYHLSGQIEGMPYRGGELDLEGELETSGIGVALPINARGDGFFSGREINLGPDAEVSAITGGYHLAAASGIPRLQLRNIELMQGPDTLIGQGTSQPDGHIILELTSGRKQVRMTGMLLPMHPGGAPIR